MVARARRVATPGGHVQQIPAANFPMNIQGQAPAGERSHGIEAAPPWEPQSDPADQSLHFIRDRIQDAYRRRILRELGELDSILAKFSGLEVELSAITVSAKSTGEAIRLLPAEFVDGARPTKQMARPQIP